MDFLLHSLTVSPAMSKIEAAAAERGVDIRNARLTDPPMLHAGFEFYITAFWRLHSCRPPGMSGVTWIPWTAMDDYAGRYEIRGTDFYRFVHYIEMMDSAYREWAKVKGEQEKRDGDNNVSDTRQKIGSSSKEIPSSGR